MAWEQPPGSPLWAGMSLPRPRPTCFPMVAGWMRPASENGDKCAWISSGQGASANVSLNGASFPVQSLWSNAFNNNTGGCVLSY